MSHQTEEQKQRVDREQEYVKEKGQEALDAARKLRAGDVEVEVPSTAQVTGALHTGAETLERFQASDRGQQLGTQAQKIVEDVKKVIKDEEKLIKDKNSGDLLQSIVRDIWNLLQELSTDPKLREIFLEWQSDLTSLFSTGDFFHFFQQAGELFTSMRGTEEFLELLTQLIDLSKCIIAEKTEALTDQDPVALAELKRRKESEKKRVNAELRACLRALSYNDVWAHFISKGEEIKEEAKEVGQETKEKAQEAIYYIRDSEHFQALVNDFKLLVQRLVGSTRSVDPLFDAAKSAWEDVVHDKELNRVVRELKRELQALIENPARLEDKKTQEEFTALAERAQKAAERLRDHKHIKAAKKEIQEIVKSIKSDPAAAQFLQDIKTLWRDITSERPGEVLDGDVLGSIRTMVVPLLLEHLNNVPLPSIEGRAEFLGKYDYTIDQMKISLPELVPENIHVRFEFEMDANPLNMMETTNQHTYLYLQASNIQLHLRDAHFDYSRLTVPRHGDSGTFDVDSEGSGMKVWMKMEIKTGEKDGKKVQYLDVLKSDVRIQRFTITFKDSKHDTLYEMLAHMFQDRIKNGVIEMIQEKLQMFGTFFSEQLLTFIEQARVKSSHLSARAKDKAEIAKLTMENLKLKAEEGIQELKADAATTALKAGLAVEGAKAVAGAVGSGSGGEHHHHDSSSTAQKTYAKAVGGAEEIVKDVQEGVENVKETAKDYVKEAGGKAQDVLDDAKAKVEEKKSAL